MLELLPENLFPCRIWDLETKCMYDETELDGVRLSFSFEYCSGKGARAVNGLGIEFVNDDGSYMPPIKIIHSLIMSQTKYSDGHGRGVFPFDIIRIQVLRASSRPETYGKCTGALHGLYPIKAMVLGTNAFGNLSLIWHAGDVLELMRPLGRERRHAAVISRAPSSQEIVVLGNALIDPRAWGDNALDLVEKAENETQSIVFRYMNKILREGHGHAGIG